MIYFIAGAGRSGSTLLDIVLGNQDEHFSLGEMINFVKNGLIDNEYCSCGKRVLECEFWSKVASKWETERELSLQDYVDIQWKYLRNKRTLQSIWNYWFPGREYKLLVSDTHKLYKIVYEVSDKKILIDSSKVPQYLLLLKKTGLSIKVIHLKRNFRDVLISTKKTLLKDPKKGVEKTIRPQSSIYSFLNWFSANTLVMIFTFMDNRIKIKYKEFINEPLTSVNKIFKLDKKDIKLLENKGPFLPQHLVAGSRIRMLKEMTIKK